MIAPWIASNDKTLATRALSNEWNICFQALYWRLWTNKKGILKPRCLAFVGIPGFEPGMTGPESVVLPLHHIPMSDQLLNYR